MVISARYTGPIACPDCQVMFGRDIASQTKRSSEAGWKPAIILPVGPMGVYRWAVYFRREWLQLVFGIGRVLHIAFWEPHFAAEFAIDADRKQQMFRLGARLHPLTVEQHAISSFKSRTTLVPARADTIGPGLFLQADRIIGGADGVSG